MENTFDFSEEKWADETHSDDGDGQCVICQDFPFSSRQKRSGDKNKFNVQIDKN
jgi:hypothetical protein